MSNTKAPWPYPHTEAVYPVAILDYAMPCYVPTCDGYMQVQWIGRWPELGDPKPDEVFPHACSVCEAAVEFTGRFYPCRRFESDRPEPVAVVLGLEVIDPMIGPNGENAHLLPARAEVPAEPWFEVYDGGSRPKSPSDYVEEAFLAGSIETEEFETVYGRFEDPVESIEFAQGNHPEAPRYEGCGGGGARVRSIHQPFPDDGAPQFAKDRERPAPKLQCIMGCVGTGVTPGNRCVKCGHPAYSVGP